MKAIGSNTYPGYRQTPHKFAPNSGRKSWNGLSWGILLLLFTSITNGQPVCDGGLFIGSLARKAPDSTWRLAEASDIKVYFYQKNRKGGYTPYHPQPVTAYRLLRPAGYLLYVPSYAWLGRRRVYLPDQRLEIIWGNDTMRVDLTDIALSAPGCHHDVMDTLQFYAGRHLRHTRNPAKKLPHIFPVTTLVVPPDIDRQRRALLAALRAGITDRTRRILEQNGLVEWTR